MKKFLIPFFALYFCLLWVGESKANVDHAPLSEDANDPKEVIARYIEAVGGKENVAKIKNSVMTMEAEMQGMSIQIKGISDQENSRLLQETIVMGNVASKTVLANGKGKITAMGQENDIPEEMLSMMKAQTYVFPEEHYEEMGYTLELQGTEDLDGEEAYRLVITAPNGVKTVEYYSVGSGLKLRTSSDATGDITYSDYKEIDGVKFPMKMSISNPMMPSALETKVVSIAFNQELSDEDFK
ncbi:peptidase, M16 family protein [Cecembia sp.]|uniref:peptidase, M16 family protein n=1 Tax=Cecembia sp. TaxID=1898110 RepID=UPI0025C422BD|nr:peptidase, M16 family protein [Cecembia sp.]